MLYPLWLFTFIFSSLDRRRAWNSERGERLSFPVELSHGEIFVHFNQVDTLYNRNSILQIRNAKGELLKSKEMNRPDTAFWLYNAKKINNHIALLFYGLVGDQSVFKDATATVVLIDYDLNIIFEKSFSVNQREYAFGNIWQESDSTFLVAYWVEPSIANSPYRYASFFYRFDTLGNIGDF